MHTALSILLDKQPDLRSCVSDIQAAFDMLAITYRAGGKLLICGNGGSAADSEHIVGELMKGFLSKRPLPDTIRQRFTNAFPDDGAYLADHLQGALAAISLVSQTSLLTAFANDVAADMVFAQQVYGYGRHGDALLAISTSGNAANVVAAIQVARVGGLHTVGLTGRSGGKLRKLCDIAICVPADTTTAIQEYHIAVYHALCTMLEEEFFPS
jgi:D-sedoheptulose 7-phosphate isomerase